MQIHFFVSNKWTRVPLTYFDCLEPPSGCCCPCRSCCSSWIFHAAFLLSSFSILSQFQLFRSFFPSFVFRLLTLQFLNFDREIYLRHSDPRRSQKLEKFMQKNYKKSYIQEQKLMRFHIRYSTRTRGKLYYQHSCKNFENWISIEILRQNMWPKFQYPCRCQLLHRVTK